MKILCSSIPALGHFHPMLPILKALAANGHEILFAAPLSFHPIIVASGFHARVAGMDMNSLIAEADKQWPHEKMVRRDQKAALMFTQIAPRALLKPLLEIAQDWKADLLLHEEGEYAAPLVAFQLGLPNVAVGWPSPMRSEFQLNLVEKEVAKLWLEAGAAPIPNAGVFRTLFLDPCPPSIQTPYGLTVKVARSIRPVDRKSTSLSSVPAWLTAMPKAPLVHVTFGTVATYNTAISTYNEIIEGLGDEKVNLVFTIGESTDSKDLVIYKNNVHVERYIEHDTLLPFCDAVICHGGCGTTISALSHGLPLIIIPQGGAVQLRNAQACERAGVGLMIEPKDVSAITIREKVLRLLADVRFRAMAEKISDEIDELPSPSDIVPTIENLINNKNSDIRKLERIT